MIESANASANTTYFFHACPEDVCHCFDWFNSQIEEEYAMTEQDAPEPTREAPAEPVTEPADTGEEDNEEEHQDQQNG